MLFCLIDEATSASPMRQTLDSEWLKRCAAACAMQANREVSAEWGGAYSVRVAADPKDITAGEIAFGIVDSLPDAPGAIAYHDRDGKAVPFALLALQTCGNLDDVSTAISHEICEAAGDPECNFWADNGAGQEAALELCDACEALAYSIDSIRVSDFLLRAFFAPGSPGPYHYLGSIGEADLASPFATAPGGYQLVRAASGNVTQVTAEALPVVSVWGSIRARKRMHAAHWSSRSFKRGARL